METNIIQWNMYNWITIVLMGAVGLAIFGAAASFIRQYTGTGSSSQGS